jgi:hypothetical protein
MDGEQKISGAWLFTAIVIGIVLIFIGALILHQKENIKPESTFSLDKTDTHENNAPFKDPQVESWRTYSNSTYNFSVNVPRDWKEQEYPSPQPNGGFMVAFSPTELPCKTCTYFRNGFYSIKLFNQKSDPDYYKDFTTRLANIGKVKDLQGVQLGKYKGVISGNTVAFDHIDWVYELSLDANNGSLGVTDSKIFQQVLTSFHFTELLFQ